MSAGVSRRIGSSVLGLVAAMALLAAAPARAEGPQSALDGEGQNEAFNLGAAGYTKDFNVHLVESSVPGCVLYPKDQPALTFQIVNLTDKPIKGKGRTELIAYHTWQQPDDSFSRGFAKVKDLGHTPFDVDLAAKGVASVTLKPKVPEDFGGYALVFEIEGHGKQFGASVARVTPPENPGKVQFPAFALDISGWNAESEIFAFFKRCGIKAVRMEIGFNPDENEKKRLGQMMKQMADADITLMITSAAGGPQPMGVFRPWLDDKDEFTAIQQRDMAPLPSADPDFQKWIEYLAGTYGWPKGPVNAIELWNEPWEGVSISGWGADCLRYRDLYTRMAQGIEDARKNAGVQVLIGGCCSSMNTEDKLFPDGKDTFLKWLDFTSIHYQPMGAFPSLVPEWRNRQGPLGPVRVWDTESWIANTESHIAAVIAVMRSLGQERTAGVLHDWTYRTDRYEWVQPNGTKKKAFSVQAFPNACGIAAVERFLGERTFKEILFKNGLPWVFVFNGLAGKGGAVDPDDATLVVVGDIGGDTERDRCKFRTVTGLKNAARAAEAKAKVDDLPVDTPEKDRKKVERDLALAQRLDGVAMTIPERGGQFRAYDYLGAPVKASWGKIAIPLNHSGYFLRTDGSKGSFEKLLAAVREAEVQGYQPVELVAHDLGARIDKKPNLRITITNVLNRPIQGKLAAKFGDLRIDVPVAALAIAPGESKDVLVPVSGGNPAASNTYHLAATFDAGCDGKVELAEDLHVNVIARRTIAVDGDLKDWEGVLPQTAFAKQGVGKNVTEKAWLPFVKLEEKATTGFTTAYLAYDNDFFYFAAKTADNTPWDGGVRYAARNDDDYFYPEKSYEVRKDASGKVIERKEHVWPEGVRRYSYRKNPDIPSGAGTDNLLIGFGVFEPGKNGVSAFPPGTMPHFMVYQCTDYEYALNPVAAKFGGGAEMWRLFAPGVPRKHFYPRQPKADRDGGPVPDGKLVIKRDGNMRIAEAAIPWAELPDVKKKLDAGGKVRFTFRVNDNQGLAYELAGGRSASQMNSYALHNYWEGHWSNELEFAFEK